MFTYLSRMRNKKAFTIVELLVVISIITILCAVGVPSFIASQRRSEGIRQSDHARGFYFAVQNTLLNVMELDNTLHEFTIAGMSRITGPNAIVDDTGNDFFIYARTDGDANILSAELALSTPTNVIAGFPAGSVGGTDPADDGAFERIINEVGGFLAGSGQDGHYFARFDSEFRLNMAYYTRFANVPAANPLGQAYTFARDHTTADNQVFGAFPRVYAFIGSFAILDNNGNAVASYDRTAGQWFGIGADSVGVIPEL
jgi:prepilin-type N-terminal cleavage/methylation domain-containing protein